MTTKIVNGRETAYCEHDRLFDYGCNQCDMNILNRKLEVARAALERIEETTRSTFG